MKSNGGCGKEVKTGTTGGKCSGFRDGGADRMRTGGGRDEDVELVPDALEITPERPDLRRLGQ